MVEAGAALRHGWDPVVYSSYEGVERLWARAALEEAEDQTHDLIRGYFRAAISVIQAGVARAFGGGH